MKSRSETLLRFYAQFRDRKPTVLEALALQPLSYWLAISFFILVATGCYIISGTEEALILLAMLIGALVRDLGWLLRFKRDWPILNRVLNWQVLEKELSENRDSGA